MIKTCTAKIGKKMNNSAKRQKKTFNLSYN
jgi:hypothetical protein